MSTPSPTAHDAYLGRTYFPELDGLRAISVLLVLTAHMEAPGRGWWDLLAGHRGVAVFFVLSGYLITMLALREESARGRLSLAAFYVRRCCRILPLYYLTLGLYCLVVFGLAANPPMIQAFRDALAYYFLYFQEAVYCFKWAQAFQNPELVQSWTFNHSWTLGVEEKFYLLWPLAAFVLWRGDLRRRLTGAALLAVVFALIPFLLTPLGPWPRAVGKALFSYAPLLLGCILAILMHDPRWFARLRGLGRPAWMALFLVALLAAHFATPWVEPPWADALNIGYALAVASLLASLLLGEGPLQRVLCWRPLAFVGQLSYAIYLIHVLCIDAALRLVPGATQSWAMNVLAFLVACLLSIGGAWALRIVVESPCIELGRRWSRRILNRPTAKTHLPSEYAESAAA